MTNVSSKENKRVASCSDEGRKMTDCVSWSVEEKQAAVTEIVYGFIPSNLGTLVKVDFSDRSPLKGRLVHR
jgi:hypothetical protein